MLDLDLWIARYRDWLALQFHSKDTQRNYYVCMRPFLAFIESLGLKSWTEVNRDVLEEYRCLVFYRKHQKTGQPLKVGSRVEMLMAVKTFFRFLAREGYLLANPASMIELPRRNVPLPAVLSEAEVLVFLEVPDTTTLSGIRDRAILEILYGTALRNGELCSLTLDQVDLGTHLIRLQRGKGDKGRVVPLGQEAQIWLEAYLEKVRPQLLRNPEVTFIFLDRWGHNGIGRAGIGKIVRETSRACKLGKTVTPHTLRHSCATHMLRRGAGLRQIQQLLGHALLSSTEHYTRIEISDLRRVIAKCHPRERHQ